MKKIAIRHSDLSTFGINFILVKDKEIALIEKCKPGFVLSAGLKHKAPIYFPHFVQ